jgi:hypothetical protein
MRQQVRLEKSADLAAVHEFARHLEFSSAEVFTPFGGQTCPAAIAAEY